MTFEYFGSSEQSFLCSILGVVETTLWKGLLRFTTRVFALFFPMDRDTKVKELRFSLGL